MNRRISTPSRFLPFLFLLLPLGATAAEKPVHRIMLLTGQSSQHHNWALSSRLVKQFLEQTGLFAVEVVTSPPRGGEMAGFRPAWDKFAAIVIDYEGDDWPDATRQSLAAYVRNGGGLVLIHATDNAFPRWSEFLEMSGIGGWGGRDETWGPKVRWRDGRMVLDPSPGNATHPPKHDFQVVVRAPDHPIMRGLPPKWMHAHDEIYSQLRGPAKNLEVLATAWADPAKGPGATGEHEPVLMTIRYGRGRVFHTTLGHVGPKDREPVRSVNSAGFIVTVQRGTEWAATGGVTQPVPRDFPTENQVSVR